MKKKSSEVDFPAEALRTWFLAHKRKLPWRENKTPYRVWVSEMMLQQTQVKTVMGYFERWMKIFPTIESLAQADVEVVIKMWEGLGYYSRARRLHAGAKYLMEKHHGELPDNVDALIKIPGIGPYTLSAILNFAFEKRSALVDGNVVRVLSRFFAIEDFVDYQKTKKKILSLAESILPKESPWEVSEAIMELGATLCQRKPACALCPIQDGCKARILNCSSSFPKKKPRPSITQIKRCVAVIYFRGEDGLEFLMRKGERGKLMEGLYEFPYFDEEVPQKNLQGFFEGHFSLPISEIERLPQGNQKFTRYSVDLFPYLLKVEKKEGGMGFWKTEKELPCLPLSSGHKRILKHLTQLLPDII